MRKSERLRLLEMQMVRMEMELDILRASLFTIMDEKNLSVPELDANKWFKNKMDGWDNKWKNN